MMVDMEVGKLVNKVADMQVDKVTDVQVDKVANAKVDTMADMVADMQDDNVADMVLDMEVDMVADMVVINVGHTACAPKRRQRRSQAGPKERAQSQKSGPGGPQTSLYSYRNILQYPPFNSPLPWSNLAWLLRWATILETGITSRGLFLDLDVSLAAQIFMRPVPVVKW